MSSAKKKETNVIDFGEAAKKKNKYFYKVENHQELYKIGESFHKDYTNGVKSFAISSTGYAMGQQVSILGIASFFDHKENVKIGIISQNIGLGSFGDVVSQARKNQLDLQGGDVEVHSFHNHFDLIEMDKLLNTVSNENVKAYDDLINSVINKYDIVFWDVPELEELTADTAKYFPVIMKFEKLSIVVAKKASSTKRFNEVQDFFQGYGIDLKGLLIKEEDSKSFEEKENTGFFNKLKDWLK